MFASGARLFPREKRREDRGLAKKAKLWLLAVWNELEKVGQALRLFYNFILYFSVIADRALSEILLAWDELVFKCLLFVCFSLITYGGRVIDAWDNRCLTAIFGRFFLLAMVTSSGENINCINVSVYQAIRLKSEAYILKNAPSFSPFLKSV